MFAHPRKTWSIGISLVALIAAVLAAGCGGQKPAQTQPLVEVKAMQVIQRDTPVTYEFVGQVLAKNEVQVRAKVAGNIVAKMVAGGSSVSEGQPLFRIDSRQYNSALLTAKAQLAQAEAVLSNSRLDTIRYRKLAAQQAIAQQTLDTAEATEQQNQASVEAYRAKVQQAEEDLADTLIVSPINGRVEVNELSVGNFVQAGQTVLATISSVDPVFVQFSMSENEYLRFSRMGRGTSPTEWGKNLKLLLSDGTAYPLPGQVEQVDRGLAQNTGTLTMKASFPNPNKLLLPGMFGRVVMEGEMHKGALLIPQRAVQELLGKTFVTVVAEGDKAETRPVTMGARVGNLWIVEEGLTAADRIVAEGAAKLQPGMSMKIIMIGPDDLKTPAKQ